MASCQTAQWGNQSPYVKLTVTETSSNGGSATLSWTLQYIAPYAASSSVAKSYSVTLAGATVKTGTFSIGGKTGTHTIASGTKVINKTTATQSIAFGLSFGFNLTWSDIYKGTLSASGSISVAAKASYTVSYNANGGSGAPASQTKWYGTAITLSSTKPTLTGHTFKGWATSASGSVVYASGASYTANAGVTLYAVWQANTYSVTYNANGGSGAPSAQTKTYGKTLTLSTVKPTRDNYNFKGWGTSATATTVAYAAGASYTANAAITLYAVWELAYTKPRINNFNIARCNADDEISDTGTSAFVDFSWETDYSVSSILIEWESTTETGSKQFTASGTAGQVSESFGDGGFSTEATYTIKLIVTDTNGYSVVFGTLNGTKFSIDFLAGGLGAAFGKPAELEGVLDIAWQTRFLGGILPPTLEAEIDLNTVVIPNTYIGENVTNYNYLNCPVTSGTFILRVESCGESGQVKQTYLTCSKYKPERYSRFYYQGEWGDWFWSNTDEVVLYENDSGSNGTITLWASASHYRYIEIYYTDNNGKTGGYTKVYNPNGKTVCVQITEPSSTIYSRQTLYTISGTSITPDITNASYYRITSASAVSTSIGTNYIKIIRVIGRA